MSTERLFPSDFLAFCLLSLAALLAASCSSSSDSAATSTPQNQPAASDTTLSSDSTNTENTASASISATPQSSQPETLENRNSEARNADISPSSPRRTAPTNIATAISASYDHSCALREDGTISCWGNNRYGQLGNGQSGDDADSSADSSEPVEVEGITDATAITTGGEHSCAVHEGGTISCWGNNRYGQLGNGENGDNAESSVPVGVAGITDATAVTAGWDYSCALHQDATISCWGDNEFGQLGNGQRTGDSRNNNAYSLVPVKVLGIANAKAIASNLRHSCALREGGTISCWGNNGSGQLGNRQSKDDGADFHSSVPVRVAGITDATAIAAGQDHSCAVRISGTVSCWGNNHDGQLGNGQSQDYENRSVSYRYGPYSWMPTGVAGITDATAIAAGGEHSCALREGGTISCWGDNWHGQLGNGHGGTDEAGFAEIENDFYSPLPVGVLGITDATAITTGRLHTCALHRTGAVSCWGDTGQGQLGNGPSRYIYASPVPLAVVGIEDGIDIATGGDHSCALREDGTISCWGANRYGQLGNRQSADDSTNNRANSSVPVKVEGITDATAIATGAEHSCALREDGTISCWGANRYGQLGNGRNGEDATSSAPVEVEGITDATAIATGAEHSCALREDSTISCWGNNWHGQLGNGTENSSSLPVGVEGITDATDIATGENHSCALHQNGTISCWGANRYGQLGNRQSGENANSSVPVRVAGITDATAISASSGSCALREDDTISCWGASDFGAQGDEQIGEDADSSEVVQVAGITNASAVTTSSSHSCALRQDGRIFCWGISQSGRLGNGKSGFNVSGPAEVIGITDATAVAAGALHTCALHRTGAISCWGRNNDGQLGNGVWHPQPVAGFGG